MKKRQKLGIANLSAEERHKILQACINGLSEANKKIIIEMFEFFEQLLKEAKINTHQLKQLLGFHSEKLKKEMETH